MENIPRVGACTIYIPTWSRPLLVKCHSLITEMPYGLLLGCTSRVPPKHVQPLGNLPRSTTSSESN